MDHNEIWHGGRPRPSPHCVRWGASSPSPEGAEPPAPNFGPFLLWPNGFMHQGAIWYGDRPQPRRHCVRWGPSSPPLKGHSPQFSANVRCGQSAGWTKMPLSMEVGVGPGDCSMGIQLPLPQKRHSPHPIFGPCLLWPNVWMDEDATCYGSRPQLRLHCFRRGPSSPVKRAQQPLPLFGPSLLWPWSPDSATAELFLFILCCSIGLHFF